MKTIRVAWKLGEGGRPDDVYGEIVHELRKLNLEAVPLKTLNDDMRFVIYNIYSIDGICQIIWD